eukprot:scaffold927_cov375-Prasinococcus_capsulatus_cf.AAC.1
MYKQPSASTRVDGRGRCGCMVLTGWDGATQVRELESFDEERYRRMQRMGLCIECKLYNYKHRHNGFFRRRGDLYFNRHDLLGKTVLLRLGKLAEPTGECIRMGI